MAVPAKKVSRARRGMRRSHQRAGWARANVCPECSEMRLPHHLCPYCGHYRGREILVVETDEDEDYND